MTDLQIKHAQIRGSIRRIEYQQREIKRKTEMSTPEMEKWNCGIAAGHSFIKTDQFLQDFTPELTAAILQNRLYVWQMSEELQWVPDCADSAFQNAWTRERSCFVAQVVLDLMDLAKERDRDLPVPKIIKKDDTKFMKSRLTPALYQKLVEHFKWRNES